MATSPDPISTIEVVHTLNPELDLLLRRLTTAAEQLALAGQVTATEVARLVTLVEKELADGDD